MVPRLPPAWHGMDAENWPILTPNGLIHADIHYESGTDGHYWVIKVRQG
jgi:hypothetical protein